MPETFGKTGGGEQLERCVKNLFLVLTGLRPSQILKLYGDLLTENEAMMLAKRLAIANGLLAGQSYAAIQKRLSVTPNTVAQIGKVLKTAGAGFKSAREFLEEKNKNKIWA